MLRISPIFQGHSEQGEMDTVQDQHGIFLHVLRRLRDVVGHAFPEATYRSSDTRSRGSEPPSNKQGDRHLERQLLGDGRHQVYVRLGQRYYHIRLEESEDERGEARG